MTSSTYRSLDDSTYLNSIFEGVVKATDDPQQMGRLRVWIPALDGEKFSVETLPWADYASPFGGITKDFPIGKEKEDVKGYRAYGFWAIPKIGSKVYIFLLNGNKNRRIYFAAGFAHHLNRSLPRGRNTDPTTNQFGPQTDDYNLIEPIVKNLNMQFGGNISADEAKTRGSYERQVAQAKTDKDGSEGYGKSPGKGQGFDYLDSQVYCMTTPGGHTVLMSDNADHCRTRIVTTSGHQIILDDSNERIYVSTAEGRNYIEMDQDGHIHVYSQKHISFRAEGDINLAADGNINIEAHKGININGTGGNVQIGSVDAISLVAGGSIFETSGCQHNICSSQKIVLGGSQIHFNGEAPGEGIAPGKPSVVPAHEPWVRPAGVFKRNSNWKK